MTDLTEEVFSELSMVHRVSAVLTDEFVARLDEKLAYVHCHLSAFVVFSVQCECLCCLTC